MNNKQLAQALRAIDRSGRIAIADRAAILNAAEALEVEEAHAARAALAAPAQPSEWAPVYLASTGMWHRRRTFMVRGFTE
ncbi:hypothetical protein ACQUFY_06335 [Robbsia andropogonis]|uniref:hypothetical protein n=1 Tax=Robbsia andropogonis TaxID=28092 RepID=UPI003D1A354A